MSGHNIRQRRGATILTAATLLAAASLSHAQSSSTPRAIINIEASHGGAGSDLTNTTISIPLRTLYTNDALNSVSTLYLTGAVNLDVGSITCYPFKNDNLSGDEGKPFSQNKPSRLSTNTVQVGSIVCSSSSDDVTPSYTNTSGVTSTLHATTTEYSRGPVSDVPNLNTTGSINITTTAIPDVPLGPGPVILTSTRSSSSNSTNMTMTSTSGTSLPTVTGLFGPPRTVTSIYGATALSGAGTSMVTSTMVVVVPSSTSGSDTSASAAATSAAASVQSSQSGGVAGRRIEMWGMAVVGLLGWMGVAALAA